MKKFLSFFLFAAISTGISSAQQKRLKEVVSDNNQSYIYYGYDNNRVDSIYKNIPSENYSEYRLLQYDENGNNTSQFTYSKNNVSDNFTLTSKIFYTYDEAGNITTCVHYLLDTYNSTGEFLFGGAFVYDYDAEGRLVTSSLYNDEEFTDLLEVMEYMYNDDELVDYVRHYSIEFGQYNEDYGEKYSYDEGKLDKITFYTIDFMNGMLTEGMYRKFIYDKNNNIIEKVDMSADMIITEKHDYKYDLNSKAEETIFPINNVDDKMLYTESANIVTREEIYYRNTKEDRLILEHTEDWIYENVELSGIGDVTVTPHVNIISLTQDRIKLTNVKNGQHMRIYDEEGRIVENTPYNDGVNISTLQHGMYMIVTNGISLKIHK